MGWERMGGERRGRGGNGVDLMERAGSEWNGLEGNGRDLEEWNGKEGTGMDGIGFKGSSELLHCILDRHLPQIRAGAMLPQVKNLADAVFDMNNLVFILVPHGGIQFRKRE